MAAANNLPETMKGLVLTSRDKPLTIETVPTPQPTIGSAIVRILSAKIISYTREVYSGKRPYPFPTPIIPGASAIGRVAAVGPDATKFKPGDLVYIDTTVRSRDDPTDVYLAASHAGFTPGSAKLMKEVYRDWTYAEYCRAPLENLTLINEGGVVGRPSAGGRGYNIEQLSSVASCLVPYGGLRDIELKAGSTIVIAPATGPFGGAAVLVALAMGARVIAMGRNRTSLANIKKSVPYPDRVETVPITGDMEADCKELKKYGPIDAYYDIGPPEAYASTHIKSCILALRHGARVSLMGGYGEGSYPQIKQNITIETNFVADVAIPHLPIMHKNIRLYGKWMYEREDIADIFKMVEAGLLDLSTIRIVGEYPLEKYKEAWDHAAEMAGFGETVVIKP